VKAAFTRSTLWLACQAVHCQLRLLGTVKQAARVRQEQLACVAEPQAARRAFEEHDTEFAFKPDQCPTDRRFRH
jgi:hypothetical protein